MDLQQRWAALVGPGPGAHAAGEDLVARWSEPHRRYHDLAHLTAVLDAVDELAEQATDADAARLAAWFHDAVYAGRPGADEAASAALAEHVLAPLGLSPERVSEVARLVMLTASHDPDPADLNGAVLCDADLAILASPPEEYAGYTERIRAEYAHVSEADFRVGRAEVLRSILGMHPLFRTATARQRWEAAARANIEAELRQLEASRPVPSDPAGVRRQR